MRSRKGTLLRRPAGAAFEYRFRVDYNGKNVEARYAGIADRLSLYSPFVPGQKDGFWRNLAKSFNRA